MPKEPYYIEYNPEDNEEETDFEDDELVPNTLKNKRGRIRESDMGIIGGEEPTTTLQTENDFQDELDQELARQKELYQKKLEKKEKKLKIKDTKRQIRRLKYAPVYKTGETLKGAGEAVVGKIQESRGTPEQRKEKRAKIVKSVKRMKAGTQKMMTALGSAGAGATGSGAIQPTNAFFGVPGNETNMFAREVGGGMGKMDLVSGGKPDNKANNLLGNDKGMGVAKMSLLSGDKKTGFGSADMFGSTSKFLTDDLLSGGSKATGKKTIRKNRNRQ